MLLFGDHRHQSRHPDTVGAHGRPHRFAVLAEHIDGERVGVLAPQLEDVPDFDTARAHQRAGPVRCEIAIAYLGGLDGAVGVEVAPGDQIHHMLSRLVSAGDPGCSGRHAGINQVANTVVQQCLRADVALLQEGIPGEVGVAEHDVLGRVECGAEALVINLAVTGQADSEQFPLAARNTNLQQHVLECVGGGDGPAQPGAVRPVDQGGDGRGVAGVMHVRRGQTIDGHRLRYCGGDRLDVGGVPGLQAAHEGVLTDIAFGQELLRGAAAHRTGDRRDNHVANRHPREHLLIRRTVSEVDRPQSVVVHIEGIGVLHDELAPTEDAGAGPGLIAVLGLDLEQQHREILVRAVLPLDRQGEQFLMRRPQQVVVIAAVLEAEHPVAIFGPTVGGLVRCARQQCREEDLLTADGHHLLTNDVLDLAQHPQPQRQPAVQARTDRAHVAGPDQQFVARHFGISRVITQGSQEQFGHTGDHSGPA